MNEFYFMFHSLTKAQSAATLLKNHGISSTLTSAPASKKASGCSYAVKVKEADGIGSAVLLRNAGIQFLKTERIPSGRMGEEVGL